MVVRLRPHAHRLAGPGVPPHGRAHPPRRRARRHQPPLHRLSRGQPCRLTDAHPEGHVRVGPGAHPEVIRAGDDLAGALVHGGRGAAAGARGCAAFAAWAERWPARRACAPRRQPACRPCARLVRPNFTFHRNRWFERYGWRGQAPGCGRGLRAGAELPRGDTHHHLRNDVDHSESCTNAHLCT